jgi:uncharacterized protein YbcV (DUF1398 family)
MINTNVINECTNKKLPFSEAIKQPREVGIERYYTDLIRLQKIYYSKDGESYIEQLSVENSPELSLNFDEIKLIEAIRANQNKQIDYQMFLKNIIAAGVSCYTVFLTGKQVSYTGRYGETYVEKFPF